MSRLFEIYQLNCFNELLSHCMDEFTILASHTDAFTNQIDSKKWRQKIQKIILAILRYATSSSGP